MKKVLFLLLILFIFFTSCKSNKDKIIGKWYCNTTDKADKVPYLVKGIIEYKKNNTFEENDTIICIHGGYLKIGNEMNNYFIITGSGTWYIKDNYLISTVIETNTSVNFNNLNTSDKIIELSDNLLITEDEKHKVTTYKRIE